MLSSISSRIRRASMLATLPEVPKPALLTSRSIGRAVSVRRSSTVARP